MGESRRLPESPRPGKRSAKALKSPSSSSAGEGRGGGSSVIPEQSGIQSPSSGSVGEGRGGGAASVPRASRPSSLLDTRVFYCGDCLEQLEKLPDQCIDLIAFGYSSDAQRECSAFHKRTGRIIKLLTVQEILDDEFVQKM